MQTEQANQGVPSFIQSGTFAENVHPEFRKILANWKPNMLVGMSDEDIEVLRNQPQLEPLPPNRGFMLPAEETEE